MALDVLDLEADDPVEETLPGLEAEEFLAGIGIGLAPPTAALAYDADVIFVFFVVMLRV